MRIAINMPVLLNYKGAGHGYFASDFFLALARQHANDSFYFYFDRPYADGLALPQNVIPVVLPPKARQFLWLKWWFDFKIELALRKNEIDVFIRADGFCSLTTKVPQVLMVSDLTFLHYPKFISELRLLYYKRYMPRFLKKAKVIVTTTKFSRQLIIDKYGINGDKILVISSAAKPIFKPINWEERENIKEKFAAGCEYFVFVGMGNQQNDMLNLLKAFSLFKKRQHTNMKLLIAGGLNRTTNGTTEKLNTYKFREDVLLLDYLAEDEFAKITAGAYALIYHGFFKGFYLPALEAMQCGVPVITLNIESMQEVGDDAVLYASPDDAADIANKMKLLFKDEQLRSRLIANGYKVAAKYSWQKSADLIWQAIEKAV